jgi:hypothetical protein
MGRDLGEARLTYERALVAGKVPAAKGQSPGEQAARWRQGVERCCEVSRLVRALLDDMEVEPCDVIFYLGFALRLDRYARRYAGETLRMQASLLAEQAAARGLDPRVLGAICRQAFDVSIE